MFMANQNLYHVTKFSLNTCRLLFIITTRRSVNSCQFHPENYFVLSFFYPLNFYSENFST